MSGRHVRWHLAAIVALAYQTACSTQALLAPARPTREADPLAGHWVHATECGFGHFVNISLRQSGNEVSGKWDEGTNLRGSEGFIKGTLREGKLFVHYCGNDESAGYPTCPEFGEESDYFVSAGTDLVRYRKFGSAHRKDVVLRRPRDGKTTTAEQAGCDGDRHADGAP